MPSFALAFLLFVTNAQDPAAAAQAVIGALRANDFAKVEAQFDDKMKAALPAGRLETIWNGLLTQVGPLKSCGSDARIVAIADKHMVITPCEFERGKLDVQLAFDAAGKISGFTMRPVVSYTPPPYATPSSYIESDITVGSAEWALPGTLTMPAGAGPFPAVVLVHGSGANDRDESLGPNKMFADLALGLASRGIAVLRYDKRSKVYGAKMVGVAGLTVQDEVVEDAVTAAALLRTRPRVDRARVFVLGHSLGGMLVPRIAAADPKLAGVIAMAGLTRPLDRTILDQTIYLANADGTVTPDEQKTIDDAQKLVAAVAALTPSDAGSTARVGNAPPSYWLDLRGYDPPTVAKPLRVPMLILQGERDYQVTMEDFARWKAGLAGRTDVTFHSYPALNHLFMAGTGKLLPDEYARPSHVEQAVIDDIAAWIKR